MNHHDDNGASATPASSGDNQSIFVSAMPAVDFDPAGLAAPTVDSAPAGLAAPTVNSALALDSASALDFAPAGLTTTAAHIASTGLVGPAAHTVPAAADVIARIRHEVATPAGFINAKMREIAGEHANTVMVRVEAQGKSLRRDHAALQRQFDKLPSKSDVAKVTAQVKEVKAKVEDLCKKMEDAHLDDDEMDESGGDAVTISVDVLEQIQDLVRNNRHLAAKIGQLEEAASDERRSRKAQARGLITRIESVEGKIVVDRRAEKKLEATVGRVEEKLATEMERVDEELEHFDREQTHHRNMIRELQQQVNQLRQTVGAGMLYN